MIFFANPSKQFQSYEQEIRASVEKVLSGKNFILGDEVQALEDEFSKYIGCKHSIGVANGTDAIELALRALDIGLNDEVITVSHTAVATVAAIEATGAKATLVDVNEEYYTLDPTYLEKAITRKTKAIIAVHLYGHPAPIEEMNLSVINTLKSAFKLPVGLSDHTFGLLASTISMTLGANVIERHFTLDRYMEGPDHILSSEPKEMKDLVELSKKIRVIMGDGIKKIQNGEYFNINLQRKCLYVNKDLTKGTVITKDNLIIKGPGGGILPKYIDLIVGRKLTEDILNDYPLTWNHI